MKYFSGTATYQKDFSLPDGFIGKDRRLYLDLGMVKNLARVMLNGKDLGVLWKAPFRVEITDAVRDRKQSSRGQGHQSLAKPVDRRPKAA